jgi:hypothetical protein
MSAVIIALLHTLSLLKSSDVSVEGYLEIEWREGGAGHHRSRKGAGGVFAAHYGANGIAPSPIACSR